MTQHGFFFDQSRCIGCKACAAACKEWHHLPPGPQKWMRVYQWEKGSFPDVRLHVLAVPCYHCAKPLCLRACPHGAISKEEKYGAVRIDAGKCRGERKCWQACPYGAIVFASDKPGEKAGKCTMCLDRLEMGQKPICVLACSMRALEFGTMEELRARFGDRQQLEEMPAPRLTDPSVVFKAHEPKKAILPWDAGQAAELWKKRGPHAAADAPEIFAKAEGLTKVAPGVAGRDRLDLKARNAEELMYATADDD
jgi:anaerobic dimethyl sulfoxide reductase subunit B